jgi:hypothetical protein
LTNITKISPNYQLKKAIEDWLSAERETSENKKSRKKSLNIPSSISMSSISVFQSSKETESKRRHKKIFGGSLSQNEMTVEQRIKSLTPPMEIKKSHSNFTPPHFSNPLPETNNEHITKRSFSTPDSLESLIKDEIKPIPTIQKRNSTPIKEKFEQQNILSTGGQMYTSSYGRNVLSRGQKFVYTSPFLNITIIIFYFKE